MEGRADADVQFIDLARIEVQGGRGGDGIVTFRREKHVPAGGPSGGDGGQGADVVLQADSNLQTLLDFRYRRCFRGDDGSRGGPNKCTGASARPTLIRVPCGTEVWDADSGALIGDLLEPDEQLLVAAGGRGGLGNAHYLSNRNRAPLKYSEGREGETRLLRLELKLLAEVGLIGLPNAGKSTLISVLSSARPRIADYPFTTLVPNLGVVRRPSGDGTVFADIPGLIAGASRGAGLGHDFLRHIERTRVLVQVIDATAADPLADAEVLQHELGAYNPALLKRPRLLVLNKIDSVEQPELPALARALRKRFGQDPRQVSAVTGTGLEALKHSIWQLLGI